MFRRSSRRPVSPAVLNAPIQKESVESVVNIETVTDENQQISLNASLASMKQLVKKTQSVILQNQKDIMIEIKKLTELVTSFIRRDDGERSLATTAVPSAFNVKTGVSSTYFFKCLSSDI